VNKSVDFPTFTCSYDVKHHDLINAGFKLQGRDLGLDSTIQPRFSMVIPLVDTTYQPLNAI
jgi:hypothetical protein